MADQPSPAPAPTSTEAQNRQRNSALSKCLAGPGLNPEPIRSIVWDDAAGLWRITTADGKSLTCP